MHIYIYDSYVNQKKYESTVARIETRITDLGLNGKIIRLGITNSVFDSVENEIKKGAKTIVAVGGDILLNNIINSVAAINSQTQLNKKIPIGYIPVGKKNVELAKNLGTEYEEKACDVLSARRVQTFDLGLVNNNYFLTKATITTAGTTIEIDKNYSLEINKPGEIEIINLPYTNDLPLGVNSNAKDGILELFIKTKETNNPFTTNLNQLSSSVFTFKNLRIINKNKPLTIDNAISIPTPVDIKIANEKISLIVGKTRNFLL